MLDWLRNLLNSGDYRQRQVGIAAAAFYAEAEQSRPTFRANAWAARQFFHRAVERSGPSSDVTAAVCEVDGYDIEVEPATMYIG